MQIQIQKIHNGKWSLAAGKIDSLKHLHYM